MSRARPRSNPGSLIAVGQGHDIRADLPAFVARFVGRRAGR